MKCGKPVLNDEQEYCFDCVKHKHHYERGYSVFVYDDIMKQAIGDFKFRNKKEFGAFFINEAVSRYGSRITDLNPDALIPVPIHASKKRFRGYNQAEIICNGIGHELGIPVVNDLLVRNRKTMPQKQLNDLERLKNLEEAFEYNVELADKFKNEGIRLSKVIIIDDIYTTGSTMEACTNVLQANGVEVIYFISICIGRGL